MRIYESIVVDAPCEDIWQVIVDPSNYPRFMQELRRSGLSASRAARREPGKGYDVARGRRVPHDA